MFSFEDVADENAEKLMKRSSAKLTPELKVVSLHGNKCIMQK